MSITLKILVALFLVVAGGFAIQGTVHYQRMQDLHDREARDDLQLLGHALEGAVTEIWSQSGEDAAHRYMELANERRTGTQITLATDVDRASPPRTVKQRASHLKYWAPITVRGVIVASLEIHRSLEPSQQFSASLRQSQIKSTIVISAAVLLLGTFLSYFLIARPTRALLTDIQQIGDGEFTTTKKNLRKDEFGVVTRAIHDLAVRLNEAQLSAEEQKRARAATLAQLRHADRLSTVGKLASGLAHELGTPLNVVLGRADLISRGDDTSPENAKHARIISERAEHMAKLIRQLLSFARRDLTKGPAEVFALIEQAAHLVEPLAQTSNITLYVEAKPEKDLIASIDARSALQVLTNLMVNGIQSMPAEGTLRIAAKLWQFDQPPNPQSAPGQYVGFVVEDEGAGIPKDQLDQIFDPFFTTKSDEEGTGLGLSVCHGIVREHGGWMDVESKPGEGTCFTAFFPTGETA